MSFSRSRREIQGLNVARPDVKSLLDTRRGCLGGWGMPEDARIRSELDVLASIERGEVVTQAALTRRIGVSIGLINALLRRAITKGYVKTRQVPYKRYAYYLTPRGFAEKSRLVAEYLDRSFHLFRVARAEYADIYGEAHKAGLTRLVLVGGGDLAEIAVLAAWGEGATLVGIVDPRSNEARRFGLPVLRSIGEADRPDAIVITDSKNPQATYDDATSVLDAWRVFAPAILKITRDRAKLIADQRRLERSA